MDKVLSKNGFKLMAAWRDLHMFPGAIIERRTNSWLSRLTCKVLGSTYSHDAINIMTPDGDYKIGDCLPNGCRLTDYSVYYKGVLEKGWKIRVLVPENYTIAKGLKISDWWYRNVKGRPYDFSVIYFGGGWLAKLLWKAIAAYVKAKYHIPLPSRLTNDFEFGYWCTEAVWAAYKANGFDFWEKEHPTPRTTEKRVGYGLRVIYEIN